MAGPKFRSRFFHPYYVLNATLLLSYVGLRFRRLSPLELSKTDMFGMTREAQSYLCCGLMLVTRALSAPTLDVYISSSFSFMRVTVLVCLFFMDTMLCGVFAILWVALYALCPQPRYRLPTSVQTLNPVTFRARTLPAQATPRNFHIIWCHAPWSSRCSQLTPVLATLVSRFEHPRINFSRIDVSRFPEVGDSLKITTAGASKQLPCVVLFEHGKELARIPVMDDQGRIPKKFLHGFTAKDVEKALDLQEIKKRAVKWESDAQKRYQQKRKS